MKWQDLIKNAGFIRSSYPIVKPVRIHQATVSEVKGIKKDDHVKIIGEGTCYKLIRIDKNNNILHLQEL